MMKDTGRELTDVQGELVGCYDALARILSDRRDELAPYEERNALKALAALWQITNGLDLDRGQVYHLGA